MRLAAAAIAAFTLFSGISAAQGYYSNRRAPSFNLPDSKFNRYDILDYRGRWLLVDFMRTDCPHCKSLSSVLEKVKARYGAKVAVLSVVLTPPDTQDTVAKYIAELKLTSPMVFDIAGQVATAFFNATPARPSFDTPHLFVINPEGKIVNDWGHSEANHEIIEGNGLFAQLDKLFAGGVPAKK